MDCEGVTKLVGTDRQRETVLLAPPAGTGEDHLPRVGANRLPYIGQPSRRRLEGRSILVAQDQAASFHRSAHIAHAVETGAGDRVRALWLYQTLQRGHLCYSGWGDAWRYYIGGRLVGDS